MNQIFLFCCFSFFALIYIGCSDDEMHKRLVRIDTMQQQDSLDSALKELEGIDLSALHGDEDIAYYNLLMAQIRYRLYLPVTSDSMINISIAHYEKEGGKMLARAYYYKGVILYELGRTEETVLCLKECEKLTRKLDDNVLNNRLWGFLGMINEKAGEYTLSVEYTRKNLALSQKCGNKAWMAATLNSMAVDFAGLGQIDSAVCYIKKCIPLLEYASPKEQVILLNNIGYFYMENDPELALEYLNKALEIDPNMFTYDNLGCVYAALGKEQTADAMWQKALETKDIKHKAKIVETMLKHKRIVGKYEEANRLAMKLIELKDSVMNELQNEKVKELQTEFDHRTEQQRQEIERDYLIFALVTMTFVVLVIILLSKYRNMKVKNRLMEKQMQIQICKDAIAKLEDSGTSNKKMIDEQNHIIETLQQKQEEALRRGKILYGKIKAGETMATWNREDFINFTDCYATVDAVFMLHLNTDYRKLSSKYKSFLILEHEGMDDCDIARTLSVSIDSLRTIRYRINKEKIK